MKDAAIGICAALVLLCCLCFSGGGKGPTLQGVFEDFEQYKANRLQQEQIEQANRTMKAYKASLNASK